MPTRIFKDGCRMVVTEYEVRTLDVNGDAINIDGYETSSKALAVAKKITLDETVKAVVVEKHVRKYPAQMFRVPDVYTTLGTFGSPEALNNGAWQ
jgi:hypothetical protein